jgi:cytochrome c-type biogenesis protein CcmF
MIPELGHFALMLALGLAVVQAVIPLIGTLQKIPNWIAVARPAAVGQFVFLAVAYGCLTYAFIDNDFSVKYVASNSNSLLPLQYRVVSVWGGHEGSLLLWVFTLSIWTVAVAIFSRSLPRMVAGRVIAVMGFISVGFLLFLIATSNPFERLLPMPENGRDLNPLLQDPGLIFHPPMLYMGYVGFSVAFAFAIAALIGGKLDSAWARWSRPWTLVAWIFLTLGIALGSWWAYYELGWGGWWFWDPVENASFMPWLAGTALLHSLAVTEKRGAFKNWTVLLAITAFSLSLLGTFLVRSGVLTSVHAFATDPERGVFILMFLGIVIGTSLILYAWRAPTVGSGGNFALVSRESFLLINNVLLIVLCASVLLGTLYPLFLDALGMGKISVGPPYFDTMFVALSVPLIILLGMGGSVRWKKDDFFSLIYRLRWNILLSIGLGSGLPLAFKGTDGLIVIPALIGAFWIILAIWDSIREKLVHKAKKWRGFLRLSYSFHGMILAHLGVAVFIIGVTLVKTYSVEKDLRVEQAKPFEVAGYTFVFEKMQKVQGANYVADQATVKVSYQGHPLAELHPQKRTYTVQTMPMTEAAIHATLFRDIYVALGEEIDKNVWAVRVYYKPFVRWIWLGALLMAVGGIIAALDGRYRRLATRDVHEIIHSNQAIA